MEALKQPNWMLRGFIVLSLVFHFFIFLRIAGIYENNSLSYIDLTMHQFSKPDVRNIPVPRLRNEKISISDTQAVKTKTVTPPEFKIDPVQARKMDNTYETISMPDIPDAVGIESVPAALPPAPPAITETAFHEETVAYTTAAEYFEMINLRIHSAKKYPESARSRHIEGRVRVEFRIQNDGTLGSIKVIKSSRHPDLDNAAMEAIRSASPFPKPPAYLFKKPVMVRINILFELA